MVMAAAGLPPLPLRSDRPRATVHVLTGCRFWYQTAFCLHSFSTHAEAGIDPEIYDDGTFDSSLNETVARFSPTATLHSAAEIRARLDDLLPESRFPVLRERWRNYPNIRKLIDPHLGSSGWKLVLDSDLLFFRRPTFLLEWLDGPRKPMHAVDCAESYGYSRALMQTLAGAPIPPLVNVGICGLRSESLNWEELEAWCAELIARERTSYYLEQALVAMLAARESFVIAPAADYITLPTPAEALNPKAVMHHYVDTAKRWYYGHAWKHTLPATR